MDLSIIIVSWNVREMLARCLESIQANVRGLNAEVIVIDNASADGTRAMVRARFPHVLLIENDHNAGFCRANNQGIGVSCGDYISLLNPDTEVRPGAMEQMVGYLRRHAGVGIVGPTLIDTEGRPNANGTRFPKLGSEIGRLLGLAWRFGLEYDFSGFEEAGCDCAWDVDVVSGACMIIDRRAIDQIGGLDERFFMFYEETDFCYRARRVGWRTAFLPSARIYHYWMGSVRHAKIRSTWRYFRSQRLYFAKNAGILPWAAISIVGTTVAVMRTIRILAFHARTKIKELIIGVDNNRQQV